MGNWSITGIVFTIGLFFTLLSLILTQININNPYTGQESTIFSAILDWITPF